ncbi:2,3,4,5-tetrahydropyridine-2,6-dicarboxylate N-acetyltransferase [Serpentinicella sp. ANB-PHB4]|uniref:2,3,4,5-tetrahydropyridine-2,6-dicarboxylate N-acetyltransferase n=1 Tax=Serpentinicella sp. ANB-PHB4 TaxID=3074076 RepID=UPI0028582925|nr:2,3,4,5-tetrahydropyridine-2,6-dicarboxylate N-acetyltransferase [Serpentinicella sp. ANB-PHB4]MDR5659562.1 2,3,4,5-tetrahydropyridine-2,6-dicarboxylate N-acetyltransferase [Serpentinicella sp. ANB-PHB4]
MPIDIQDPKAIAKYIKDAKKTTPIKAYIQGYINKPFDLSVKSFGSNSFWILIGEFNEIKEILDKNKNTIEHYHLEFDRKNSAIPLLNLLELNARIEPGAVIREGVIIQKNVVIMMGAVINIGATIGQNTMIDMNCVIGARAIIGKNVHVGAGTVIAGVLEPPSSKSVVIEDNVFIGANVVVLEGVVIGKGAVIGAGSVVTKDIRPNTVVAGTPAKIIKTKDNKTNDKVQLLEDLR